MVEHSKFFRAIDDASRRGDRGGVDISVPPRPARACFATPRFAERPV